MEMANAYRVNVNVTLYLQVKCAIKNYALMTAMVMVNVAKMEFVNAEMDILMKIVL